MKFSFIPGVSQINDDNPAIMCSTHGMHIWQKRATVDGCATFHFKYLKKQNQQQAPIRHDNGVGDNNDSKSERVLTLSKPFSEQSVKYGDIFVFLTYLFMHYLKNSKQQ